MRLAFLGLAAVLVGCSQSPSHREDPSEDANGTKAADISAAPVAGVALNYDYSFRVPIGSVADVQEQHASRCEALGPTRCRITAMTYRVSANRTIDALLTVKLAPDLARRFGRESVAAIVAHGGMLAEAELPARMPASALPPRPDKRRRPRRSMPISIDNSQSQG